MANNATLDLVEAHERDSNTSHTVPKLGAFEIKSDEKSDGTDSRMEAEECPPGEASEVCELDEKTNRRILRRIDLFIMPTMFLIIGLCYLDKVVLGFAAIMGLPGPPAKNNVLQGGIGLEGSQYSWLASLLYLGSLVWQWPTNRLMQRFPIASYNALNAFAWGVILTCHVVVVNFAGAAVLRTLLGAFEAAVIPGYALITARWYRREEQGLRTAIWFSANGPFQVLGSVLAWGILRGSTEHATLLAPWRILFLVTGLLTVLAAIFSFILIPNSEKNAWWLSKSDRALSVLRTRDNWRKTHDDRHWDMGQFKEALTDQMTWALCLASFLITVPNGGLSNFFSQLVVGFGFSPENALLYTAPAGAIGSFAMLLSGALSLRFGLRILWGMIALAVAVLGVILIVALPKSMPWGRLAGYWLCPPCAATFVSILSLVSSNIGGQTKQSTVAALFMISYGVGNIVGPQTFRAKDAPNYTPGVITLICCWGAALFVLAYIWWYYEHQNAKKAKIRADPGYVKPHDHFLDQTDRQNPEFTYVV